MLDSETKRRIDNARDILVGKVPDPKSQVEQITIALIYKFMDDMDKQAEEMGGKASFFVGEDEKYAWRRIFDPRLGGFDMLGLYSEALIKINQNANVPQLFRDIFKNAYLPYRDPETLKLFLKQIDEFRYDHSERLGDAFEYLLSVLGSQGDAGQFRTPRHIIDFIVEIVDPKKDESILDPACGTAGFMISAYKHILKNNPDLNPGDRKRLMENVVGYDISPDMVRLSLANLYLHDFRTPRVYEYDTLTSEDRWNEYFDVILANPPFMSPKGGIKPHKKFSVESKRSEVLFVDYIAEHLTPNGRAGIIVPEGIIFQSQTAYEKLRRMLVEGFLVGVISLPSGVFMPYTGVKTSILLLDRSEAKRNPHVLFSDVRHIGFSLGVKRTVTEHNDLPQILQDYAAYYRGGDISQHSWLADRRTILSNGSNLSGTRYRPSPESGAGRFVALGDVCTITKGKSSSTKTTPGPYRLVLTAAESKTSEQFEFDSPAVCVPLISSLGHGKAALHRIHYADGKFALANLLVALQPNDPKELDTRFLYHTLDSRRDDIAKLMQGAANVSMKPEDLARFEIPLPPLEVQKETVAEIEGYRKVMDGARAVLDHYRPHIPIQPDWPMRRIGDVCSKIMDGAHFSPKNSAAGKRMYVTSKNIRENRIDLTNISYVSEDDFQYVYSRCPVTKGDVLYIKDGANTGISAINTLEEPFALLSSVAVLRGKDEELDNKFLSYYLNSEEGRTRMLSLVSGVAITRLTLRKINDANMPLPTLEEQRAIVSEIEAERRLVEANHELIARMETKIAATLARIWGSEEA